jgi:hypothetical protein
MKKTFNSEDLTPSLGEIHFWKCTGCWEKLKETHVGKAPKCPRCADYMAPVNGKEAEAPN